jgi:hypothetical protein
MPRLLSLSLPVQEALKPVSVDTLHFTLTELIFIFCSHCLLSNTTVIHFAGFYTKLEMFQILRLSSGTSLRLFLGPFTALLVASGNWPLFVLVFILHLNVSAF